MTIICAVPYDTSASAFYFDSMAEYHLKYNARLPVEEYELQYIEGCNPKLFSEAGICQSTIETWFDSLSNVTDNSDSGIAIRYLLNLGYSLYDAIEKADEISIFRGKSCDYAYEVFSDSQIPEHLRGYIDYDAIARDLEINGELVEFCHETLITNAHDF